MTSRSLSLELHQAALGAAVFATEEVTDDGHP